MSRTKRKGYVQYERDGSGALIPAGRIQKTSRTIGYSASDVHTSWNRISDADRERADQYLEVHCGWQSGWISDPVRRQVLAELDKKAAKL